MKSFIITGAGSGLGRDLSLLLAEKNYHIILTGRNEEKLAAVKKEIENRGGSSDFVELDIRNADDINKKTEELCKKFQVYGLVNNAGVGHFGPFVQMKNNEIAEMIDTNVIGTIQMTGTILSHLNEGHIINIISTAGLRGKVNEAVYCASKFALKGFTESLQKEYEGTGIRFTAVYMGGMDTPFWEDSDHIKDTSRLRPSSDVAEIIISQMEQDEIIIENKKS